MPESPHTIGLRPSAAVRRLALGIGVAGLLVAGAPRPAGAADETHLYWGDVHLHSNYSIDAYGTGNVSVTPDLAYRYARGIPILHPSLHTKVKIRRPLDFLAVTDHAINMGADVLLDNHDALLQQTEWGRRLLERHDEPGWVGIMRGGARGDQRKAMMDQVFSRQIRQSTWNSEIDAAQKNYVPGTFTTLIGWEWTAMKEGKNLHRCVISNADPAAARRFFPLSNYESNEPEDLWSYLEKTKQATGVDFVAIPHNSNLSGGLMFDMVDSDGMPITAQYARQRARWESVVEVTQTKGTSEVRPELAPNDEFAEFEIRRKLLAGAPTPPDEGDYVRSALLRGLELERSTGVNPYKLGMIGSTDNHVGMSSVQESDFMGKLAVDALPSERLNPSQPVIFPAWEMSASGRAAVWATENTREAIFAAFKRKEVYATTGTRIRLRVFGGFSFRADDANAKDVAAVGYGEGVPMGGDLTNAPEGQAPTLLIYAAKDPLSGNLDRIQVIKGWIDAAGDTHQRVYEAAWSGDRKPGADGKLPPVGNTVDVGTATYANTIGAAQLATVWKDPDFDPEQTAFYYARVIEIPTPRHSLYDAVALGVDVGETAHPATIQERAYSSPIWYTPAGS
jgi:hypothetical protein